MGHRILLKILKVIPLTVYYTIYILDVSLEKLVLDQQIIPLLIYFSIPITCLFDIVLI